MPENVNDNIKKPNVSYVTIEIKKTKIDENGHIFETVEEKQVPDFLADLLIDAERILIEEETYLKI